MMDRLRDLVPGEEFDYGMLMSVLQSYAKPRNKVTRLLKSGDIIRVKKGLYVFGPRYQRHPICLEALANLIYGPSYISLESALSYYGMIPERVEWTTSMTTKKNKEYHTPLGNFSYRHLHPWKYMVGVTQTTIDDRLVLMASREKALADLIAPHRDLVSTTKLESFLTENLRIDWQSIDQLDTRNLDAIATAYRKPAVHTLLQLVRGF